MTTVINENDRLDTLDEQVQENSNWEKITQNETKRLQFVLKETPEYKEDEFKGSPTGVWKTFYKVIDVNSSNKKIKTFKANTRSTRKINDALRQSKDLILDVTHTGTGTDTIYVPKVVNPKSGHDLDEEKEKD